MFQQLLYYKLLQKYYIKYETILFSVVSSFISGSGFVVFGFRLLELLWECSFLYSLLEEFEKDSISSSLHIYIYTFIYSFSL